MPMAEAVRRIRLGGSKSPRLALRFRTARDIVGIATSWWEWSLNNPILPRGRCLSQVSRTSTPISTYGYLNGVHNLHNNESEKDQRHISCLLHFPYPKAEIIRLVDTERACATRSGQGPAPPPAP